MAKSKSVEVSPKGDIITKRSVDMCMFFMDRATVELVMQTAERRSIPKEAAIATALKEFVKRGR